VMAWASAREPLQPKTFELMSLHPDKRASSPDLTERLPLIPRYQANLTALERMISLTVPKIKSPRSHDPVNDKPPKFSSAAEEALWYFPLDDDVPLILTDMSRGYAVTRVHRPACHCPSLSDGSCPPPVVIRDSVDEMVLILLAQLCYSVGNTLRREFFSGSPQEHAVLNKHLVDYFKGRSRAQETTPYAIPSSQMHLLADLGMEVPQPDAPEVPHALHKSIEEGQLRRMRQWLSPNNYGVVSVKSSKLHLLPQPGSVQNPVYEAKDVARYPGIGVKTVKLDAHPTYFMHDVSSEVSPHELVERLDSENPTGHLFVTGMNPHEVLDRANSFEPASHDIDYDLNGFNFIFAGSPSESYFTPIDVTVSWLRTSSVRSATGRVYHVVLLDYKLGHCVWHIFSGDAEEQHTRTFSTGSYVRIPASATGTWKDEWLPTKLLTGILAFTTRTPDLSTRNLSAKVSQLATSIMPRQTSREQWVASHIAHRMAPVKTWDYVITRGFWNLMYLLSFQWQLLGPLPDLYHYVDERRRYRTIHPTPGGGWSPMVKTSWRRSAIPNCPTMLQRLSAFTSTVFTFLIPKILVGEILSNVIMHVPLWELVTHLTKWMDLQPLRVLLTFAIIVVTAILPGHVVKIFSRLAGHFWRQLWLPGWVSIAVERSITEVCGGPGATILMVLPGRGWFFQAYLWSVGLLSVLPGLIPHCILPTALVTGWFWVPLLWWSLIALEHAAAIAVVKPFSPGSGEPTLCWDIVDWWKHFMASDLASSPIPLHVAICRVPYVYWPVVRYYVCHCLNFCSSVLAPPVTDLRQLPAFVNLPPLPDKPAPTVRVRNVDKALPVVVVQASNFPSGISISPLAVDPQGMTFLEWVRAVERAYANCTTKYPALTPGQSCFWECVATFGGTSHMWYSWFMEVTGRKPDPTDPVVGNVFQADILNFAAASGFGISLTGLSTTVVHPTRTSWPTIPMVMSHSVISGLTHVEIASPGPLSSAQANLSRVLRTIRPIWPQWELAFQNSLNASPVDSSPEPSALLVGMCGDHALPRTRNEVVSALIGSFSCLPIDPNNQEGFAIDFAANRRAPWPPLYDYNQNAASRAIGAPSPGSMWQRFRLNRTFRVKVPVGWTPSVAANHEEVVPVPGKIGATHAQRKDNAAVVSRPNPSHWVAIQQSLEMRLAKYRDLALPAVHLEEEVLEYTADLGRAARLVSDLKAHPSVLESFHNPAVLQSLDNIVDLYKLGNGSRTVKVRAYFGVWGCGKTTATKAYLQSLDPDTRRQARIISHTESLRAQAKAGLDFPELRGFNFPTIASAITESCTGPAIFDDAGKFWGGMLDLIILANPLLTEVVVNGDPAQGLAKFPVAGTQSEYDDSPIACLAPLVTRYATVTHRGFGILANTLGVHTTNPLLGHITHTTEPMAGLPVCTASPRYAGVLAAGGRQAYTYSSVQGEDFKKDMEVDMTGLEGSVMDRSAYVALTRSSTGVYVHMDAMDPDSKTRQSPTGSVLMNSLICAVRSGCAPNLTAPSSLVKAAFYRHLEWCMPSLPWFARVGATVAAAEYQSVFPAVEYHAVEDAGPSDPGPGDHTISAAPPVDELTREVHFHAKEHRELPGPGGSTDQFKDVAFVNPHVHKRADTTTYLLSVKKRLTPSSVKANTARMLQCSRSDLCSEYDRLVTSPPQWTAAKFEQYCERAVSEYASKRSYSAVIAKLRAHDPSRTASDIIISLKNQIIKKDEKRNKVEAIPGQLIHEYDITHTLADAPFALFLEDEIIPAFPDNFLFYRRMNPEQFIVEYQKRWRVNNGVHTSDVTRWDVGCDAGVLNFDIHVMRKSGFPEDYVRAYIERRLGSSSRHGTMATMQNSGDRYTWPLNSVRRAVVASLINHVTPKDTVAINGDDEAIDRYCESDLFPDSQWEFKNQNGPRGEFSGFELGGPIPEYSARGIQYRSIILESRDPSAQNKWLNYLGLLQHANHDTPEAMDVARSASRYMSPDLFRESLPVALRGMFPSFF